MCGRRAVYLSRASGIAYCEKHFLEYFDRKVRRTLRKYSMLGPHEHIVVAVSGGKDSLSLLHYLHKLSRRVPGWRITALLVDEGISGYREVTKKDFLRVVEELGVDYHIVSFKEEFGYTLDEMVRIGRKRGLPYLPCTYCGVFRRYLLNKAARELGATVLATAHNLDDVVQTFLINVMSNDWERIVRLAPVSERGVHPKLVPRVKPFYEVLEKETTLYAVINGLYPSFVECPYARLSPRWYVRKFLNEMEERTPGTKYSLLRSLLKAIELLRKLGVGEGRPGTCSICGEASAHPICRACELRMKLGIMVAGDATDTRSQR